MRKSLVLLLILTVTILIIPSYGYSAQFSQKKAIMFIVDNVNYDDLVNYGQKNIKFLLENGSLGLMNPNSGGAFTSTNAYATIGAGSYAVSSVVGTYAGGYDDLYYHEEINKVYKRNTGREMDEENIANIDILGLKLLNERLNRPVKIGLLGSLLNEHGYKTAIVGNEATSLDEISISASLITMNNEGITNYGKVDSSLLTRDFMSPFGLKTDYDALFNAYKEVKNKADFIVIQTGDTYRLNKYMSISDERLGQVKAEMFEEIDGLLGKVLENCNEDTLFMLVVPFPSSEDVAKGRRLTPVIVFNDSLSKGVLTSATTKRDGIITNTDLAAHILSYFQIAKPSVMTGHQMISKSIDEPLDYLKNLNEISVFNYTFRGTVVKTYIGFIIVVLLLSFVLMIYFKPYVKLVKPLLIAVLITPTALLILPLFNPWNTVKFVICLISTVTILSLSAFHIFKDNLKIFISTCLLSTGIILLDTFLGNPLMRVSILGYDPIVGARFYGIGNEYMGFLLGTTIVGTAALIDKYRDQGKLLKAVSIIIYAIVLITLMLPTLGTNVGGTMAAFIGLGTATLLHLKRKITQKDFTLLGCLLLIFLLILFIYDGMQPSEKQSHIGQTSSLIKQNSVFALFQIFGRKLATNYKLIRYSTWTLVLIATIVAQGILFRWPVGILKEIFRNHSYLYFGFISGIMGTMAAFIFNDSGVVAAAMSMVPITIPLIMMCIDEDLKVNSSSEKNP